MLRKIVEQVSRGKYFARKLPLEFSGASLFVSPDSQLKYLKPGPQAFDKELLDIALEFSQENSVIWDIGANVGVFTFAAASLVGSRGHVLAVEPDVWLANLIQKSTRLRSNHNFSVDVLPAAVSDSSGIETFLVASRGRASNALAKAGGRSQTGGFREKSLVPAFSLDDLLSISERPNFIKIDIEGGEVAALRGGKKILSEVRPIIYCEVGFENRNETADILRAADYKIFDSSLPKESRFAQEKFGFNILAYPNESLDKQITSRLPTTTVQSV